MLIADHDQTLIFKKSTFNVKNEEDVVMKSESFPVM